MANRKPLPRLLCYDISDPRRLGRVHRIVSRYAISLQYSVFYLYIDAETLDLLCQELQDVIDPREDDIRIYPLQNGQTADILGKQGFPEGMQLLGAAIPEGLGTPKAEEKT